MKAIWYNTVRVYVKLCFRFYFKKIITTGAENIPKNKPTLYLLNHQNALVDALLIATAKNHHTFFLTQAGVFKNPFVKKILIAFNMIPIYRIRDGYSALAENEKTFNKCYDILNQKKELLIFPEGSHNIKRRVRTFQKGFAKIVFGAFDQNKDLDIQIIPVGMNYTDHMTYASSVHIVYGKPISAKKYWEIKDRNQAIQELRKDMLSQLKLLTTHIEDLENYNTTIHHFNKKEFLFPEKVNTKLKTLDINNPIPPKKEKRINFLSILIRINSFFPLLVWKKVKPGIKQQEFIATFKFALVVVLFPVFYMLQACIIGAIFGGTIGWSYLTLSVLFAFVLTKS